jgi:hypothetical protein
MSDEFTKDEVLIWQTRANPDAVLEKRQVTFVGWKDYRALVSFGLTNDGRGDRVVFSVSHDELTRPAPQPFYTPEPPPAPIPVPLDERRERLRQC